MRPKNTGQPAPPDERIIRTARELFLTQGFAATTVNQLIDASGTHKASFYRYFDSKEAVAAEYLNREEADFLNAIGMLFDRARDPADFVRRWCRLIRKQVRTGQFEGCKVSRLVQTLEKEHADLRLRAANILEHWIAVLANYFAEQRDCGYFAGNPERTAEKVIRLFQGSAAMYRLHGKLEVFVFMEEDMLAAIQA